jgi:hypothetical protein
LRERSIWREKKRNNQIDVLERIETLDNNGLLPLNGRIHCKLKNKLHYFRGIALNGVFCVFHLGFDKTNFELDLICLY